MEWDRKPRALRGELDAQIGDMTSDLGTVYKEAETQAPMIRSRSRRKVYRATGRSRPRLMRSIRSKPTSAIAKNSVKSLRSTARNDNLYASAKSESGRFAAGESRKGPAMEA